MDLQKLYFKKDLNHSIRSFVLRHKKLNTKQKDILLKLWPIIGINFLGNYIELNQFFLKPAPIVIDIGFGTGDSLINSALLNPKKNFLGIEVYLPGISSCLSKILNFNLIKNIRIIYYDAVEVLKKLIPYHTITKIQLFFPDPWHKTKHHKRRIIQPNFIELLNNQLTINGKIYIITDYKPYVEHIIKVFNLFKSFKIISLSNNYLSDINNINLTKYEIRSKKLGNLVWKLIFRKII